MWYGHNNNTDDEVQTSNRKIELGALYRSYTVRRLKQKATITTDYKQFKTQETNQTRHTLHTYTWELARTQRISPLKQYKNSLFIRMVFHCLERRYGKYAWTSSSNSSLTPTLTSAYGALANRGDDFSAVCHLPIRPRWERAFFLRILLSSINPNHVHV